MKGGLTLFSPLRHSMRERDGDAVHCWCRHHNGTAHTQSFGINPFQNRHTHHVLYPWRLSLSSFSPPPFLSPRSHTDKLPAPYSFAGAEKAGSAEGVYFPNGPKMQSPRQSNAMDLEKWRERGTFVLSSEAKSSSRRRKRECWQNLT